MKLPRYLKLEEKGKYDYILIVKRWGITFLFYKVFRDKFEKKWYHWLTFYPYICLKTMLGVDTSV